MHLFGEGLRTRAEVVGRCRSDGAGRREPLFALQLELGLGELGPRRRFPGPRRRDPRLRAGDLGPLVTRVEHEQDLAQFDDASLVRRGLLDAPDELRRHVDLDLRNDVSGRRELDLALRWRDQGDLGHADLGLEKPGFHERDSDTPRSDAGRADHSRRDEPANGPGRRRRGWAFVAVDSQGREVRGEAIVHVCGGPA